MKSFEIQSSVIDLCVLLAMFCTVHSSSSGCNLILLFIYYLILCKCQYDICIFHFVFNKNVCSLGICTYVFSVHLLYLNYALHMGDEAFVIFSEVGLGVWKSPVIE